mgnify:FL=1
MSAVPFRAGPDLPSSQLPAPCLPCVTSSHPNMRDHALPHQTMPALPSRTVPVLPRLTLSIRSLSNPACPHRSGPSLPCVVFPVRVKPRPISPGRIAPDPAKIRRACHARCRHGASPLAVAPRTPPHLACPRLPCLPCVTKSHRTGPTAPDLIVPHPAQAKLSAPIRSQPAVPILLLRCLESSGCGFENRDDPLKRLSREPCSIERDGIAHEPCLEVNDGLSA